MIEVFKIYFYYFVIFISIGKSLEFLVGGEFGLLVLFYRGGDWSLVRVIVYIGLFSWLVRVELGLDVEFFVVWFYVVLG